MKLFLIPGSSQPAIPDRIQQRRCSGERRSQRIDRCDRKFESETSRSNDQQCEGKVIAVRLRIHILGRVLAFFPGGVGFLIANEGLLSRC